MSTPSIVKFYSYFRSSTAYRLRIALNLKNVTPLETVFVNLKTGEQHSDSFKAINPAAAVPAFELTDGTIITQSMAMLEWLDETYPQKTLLPVDKTSRAKVRAFSNAIATDMHPVNNLRVLQYVTGEMGLSDEHRSQWMHHWMHKGFEVCEAMVENHNHSFCYAETPTMADICLIPQIYNALRFKVDMASYPKLMKIYNHALKHPAFAAAMPEKQPDSTLAS